VNAECSSGHEHDVAEGEQINAELFSYGVSIGMSQQSLVQAFVVFLLVADLFIESSHDC
jgi:hypothetical protein